jgi:shikimate kinase
VVSCGGGTPCYNNNANLINDLGLSVYLKLSPELLKDRLVNEKSKRPLISDLTDTELLEFITRKLEERSRFYECANMLFEYSREKESEFIQSLLQSIVF